MTRLSTSIFPSCGHSGGTPGSIYSGGSRGKTENSFTRSIATILCSKPLYKFKSIIINGTDRRQVKKERAHTKRRTMKRRSLVTVVANTNAKPAVAAVIFLFKRTTAAVTPRAALDKRLNLMDIHRLTLHIQ
jgi:hypothetical protein